MQPKVVKNSNQLRHNLVLEDGLRNMHSPQPSTRVVSTEHYGKTLWVLLLLRLVCMYSIHLSPKPALSLFICSTGYRSRHSMIFQSSFQPLLSFYHIWLATLISKLMRTLLTDEPESLEMHNSLNSFSSLGQSLISSHSWFSRIQTNLKIVFVRQVYWRSPHPNKGAEARVTKAEARMIYWYRSKTTCFRSIFVLVRWGLKMMKVG